MHEEQKTQEQAQAEFDAIISETAAGKRYKRPSALQIFNERVQEYADKFFFDYQPATVLGRVSQEKIGKERRVKFSKWIVGVQKTVNTPFAVEYVCDALESEVISGDWTLTINEHPLEDCLRGTAYEEPFSK